MNEEEQPGAPLGPFFLGYSEPGAEEEFQVFKDYGQALTWMETPEVEEGAYRLFDSAGRQAVLGTQDWDVIEKGWSQPKPNELRAALSAFLRRKGFQPPETGEATEYAREVASILEELEEREAPSLIRRIRRVWARLTKSGRTPS